MCWVISQHSSRTKIQSFWLPVQYFFFFTPYTNSDIVIGLRTGSQLRFGCSVLENQYPRDKWWWGKNSCFIQEGGNLGTGWVKVSKTIFFIQGKPERFQERGTEKGGGYVQKKQVLRPLVFCLHDPYRLVGISSYCFWVWSSLNFWESWVFHSSRPVVCKLQGK